MSVLLNEDEYPNILVSDENDENPRAVRFAKAIECGWNRRTVAVCLVDTHSTKVLLQKRSQRVSIAPGTWSLAAAGHVDEGESREETALKELQEELGITASSLQFLRKDLCEYPRSGDDATRMRAWHAVYVVEYQGQKMRLEPTEVSEVAWFSIEDIDQMLAENPGQFIGTFPKTWERIRDILFT